MNILVVDDNAAVRKIIIRILSQIFGHEVNCLEAGDGFEALDVLGRGQKTDLLFVDLNMPRMDGMQLLGAIRETPYWKNIPIIVVTTEGRESVARQAKQLGAIAYVRKPFTGDQISEVLIGAGLVK